MFTCPAVRPQFSRLLGRHIGFLVALFAFQTLALVCVRTCPIGGMIVVTVGVVGLPFAIALMFLCVGLGYGQVFTNRSLLDRAHREFSS